MLVFGQCNRTVKGTVNTSCLCKWTERVKCVRSCLTFRRVNCLKLLLLLLLFFFYQNVQPMPSFFLKFCHSFD